MDREKLKNFIPKVNVKALVAVAAVAGFAGLASVVAKKGLVEHGYHWFATTYGHALSEVHAKMDHLRKTDEENERLRLENSHLRLMVESLQFDCHADSGAKMSRNMEEKLDRETGSKLGRTLASINYKLPVHLLPTQLHTLGLTYFKAREDEKSAVIFTFLTNLEDDNTFKTVENHLLTGITWYRLDNLEVAETYFDKVLKTPENRDNGQYIRQAKLWKGLIAERQGKHQKSQFWLREVLGANPHSAEASWINTGGTRRVAAHEE